MPLEWHFPQSQSLPDIVYPCDTLQSHEILFGFGYTGVGEEFLYLLLRDELFPNLDKGWVRSWLLGVRHADSDEELVVSLDEF